MFQKVGQEIHPSCMRIYTSAWLGVHAQRSMCGGLGTKDGVCWEVFKMGCSSSNSLHP
jgi:hypothetical protein